MSTDQQVDPVEADASLSVGATLRQARHDHDLSEKQVADRLHITMHYIKALETDRYEKLPGAVFAKGYIKAYAELLGLDATAVLGKYEAYEADRKAAQDASERLRTRQRQDRNKPWVIASVVVFIGGFIGLWAYNSWNGEATDQAAAADIQGRISDSQPGEDQPRATATLQPATITPADTVPVDELAPPVEPPVEPDTDAEGQVIAVNGSGEDVLRISFSGDSWVEVNNGDARQIYRDLRHAGDVLEITGRGPFSILLGDAPLAHLEFNGDEVDVSDDIRIDNSARLTVGL